MRRFAPGLKRLKLALALAGLAGMAWAAPDWHSRLNYQGQLTNNLGEPVADGTYAITFRLYGTATGGSVLWVENQSLNVNKGLFNAILGSVNPLDLDLLGGGDGWLSVEVNGNGEMSPRQQLLPAPQAQNARRLEGYSLGLGAYNIVQLDGSGKIPAGLVSGGSVSVPLDLSQNNSTYILRAQNTGSGVGVSATTASGTAPAVFGRGVRSGGDFSVTNDLTGIAVTARSVNGYASLVDRPVNAQVYGQATVGPTVGVRGENTTATGLGVLGLGGLAGVSGVASADSTNATGVFGSASGSTARVYGVRGLIHSTHWEAAGVLGRTTAPSSSGVRGEATSDGAYGVRGHSSSPGWGYGVFGSSDNSIGVAGTGGPIGVRGESFAASGAGVDGYSEAESSPGVRAVNADGGVGLFAEGWTAGVSATAGVVGVYGNASNSDGVAGRFIADATSGVNTGVHASTNSGSGYAGRFTGGQRAIVAEGATIGISATASNFAGYFRSTGWDGIQVISDIYWGVDARGGGIGVRGQGNNVGSYGVYGTVSNASSYGVYGLASGTNSYGVYGTTNNNGSVGVYGISSGTTSHGVQGRASGSSSYGVLGEAVTNAIAGVRGTSSVLGGRGVEGIMTNSASTGGYGGFFSHAGTGYGVRVESNGHGIDVRAAQVGLRFDQAANPVYGLYWYNFNTNAGNSNFAVYAYNHCHDCRAGYFSNTSATASTTGYALRVEGQVFMPQMAGVRNMGGLTSAVVTNAYVASSATIALTPDRDIGSGNRYWVESIGPGTFTIRIATAVAGLIMHYVIINR